MPFQKGREKTGGRTTGSGSGGQRKEKFASRMEKVWESSNPEQVLRELLKEDPKEFLRLYAYLFPKDTNVSAKVEHNYSPDQLRQALDRVLAMFKNCTVSKE